MNNETLTLLERWSALEPSRCDTDTLSGVWWFAPKVKGQGYMINPLRMNGFDEAILQAALQEAFVEDDVRIAHNIISGFHVVEIKQLRTERVHPKGHIAWIQARIAWLVHIRGYDHNPKNSNNQ